MKMARLAIAALVIALGLCLGVRALSAQPAPSDQRTPAGIAFRHIALPQDTHHALAFGWTDGFALTLSGKEGLAVLGPRLMLEGSRAMGESDRIERLKDLQASLSLSGSAHFTRGALDAPAAKFAEAAEVLADLLANPALPPDKLARAKRSLALSSRQNEENAETLANRLFMRLILSDGPSLRLAVADPAIYAGVEVADVEAWRRAVLGRDRLTIASAGPLTAEAVGREIDRIFAGLSAVGRALGPPPPWRTAPKLVVLERKVVQTAIVAGGPSGWTLEPDLLPGTIAVRALGGGFESRLVRAVREKLGAAYRIGASFHQLHPKAFALVISTAVDNAKAVAAVDAIRQEYGRLLTEGVPVAEIEPLKTKLVTETREQTRRATSAAARLRDLSQADFPPDFLPTYEARVRAVEATAVAEGMRTNMPKPPLTFVVVAPSAEGFDADCVIKAPEEIARCE
jgi:zinc protease